MDSFTRRFTSLSSSGGHGGEVGEVEAQEVGLHQGAGLMHVVAQHGLQGLVQQVGGGVGPAGWPGGAWHVDRRR